MAWTGGRRSPRAVGRMSGDGGLKVHTRQKSPKSQRLARTFFQTLRTQPFNHVRSAMRSPNPAPSVQHAVAISMPDLLSPDLAKSLAEVGFLAIDLKDWSRAQQIFSVLMGFRLQSECPYVGLSLIELLQCRWEVAAHWASLGLAQVPGSWALAELQDRAVQRGVMP